MAIGEVLEFPYFALSLIQLYSNVSFSEYANNFQLSNDRVEPDTDKWIFYRKSVPISAICGYPLTFQRLTHTPPEPYRTQPSQAS